MRVFDLSEAEVAAPVRAAARSELDALGVRERFALAAWSCIAEPGDRDAGAMVRVLGAGDALQRVLDAGQRDAALIPPIVGIESSALAAALERWRPRLRSATVLHAVREAARLGIRMLTRDDPEWPVGLDDLGDHAPHLLWVRGDDAAMVSLDRSFALVGARAATGYGEHITAEAAAGLSDRGFTIVSGAAYGIDGVAHRVTLAGGGTTVAFLAGGVDRPYPSGHEALIARIMQQGAVVAEVPCGTAPTRWRFLQRNRLIAAATQATVVLEAGYRSGSLNTAGHAAALGRPLGAVPGPVTSPASAGCHRLIREYDAALVTTPAEMAALHPEGELSASPNAARAGEPDAETTRLLDAMSLRAPRTPDDLSSRSGLSVGEVRRLLATLELDGVVSERPDGGWVRQRPAPGR